jgi:hypothetical protein
MTVAKLILDVYELILISQSKSAKTVIFGED